MLQSNDPPQKVNFVSPCEITTLGAGHHGITISFTRDRNITLCMEDAVTFNAMVESALGKNGLKFVRLTKQGTGRVTVGPSPKGVSIASMQCPLYGDQQVTLNFIAMDGEVIGVDLCHNGQERARHVADAKRYL